MNIDTFIEETKKLGINLTDKQLSQLEKYYNLLIEWNNKINLTRIVEKEDVYLKHFYDSLTISKVIDLNNSGSLCDIGTGAGFPGVVLKIVYPNLKVTLVDSLNKRIVFLNEVIKKLELTDIEAIHSRAEDIKDKYDIVTSRAVANLKKLSEYCLPLVKENGYFIPMKANVEEELIEAKDTIKKLNGTLEKQETFYLPIEESIRNILLIKKL